MNELLREIQKVKAEVLDLERQLSERKAFVAGLERAFKLQNKSSRDPNSDPLRPESQLFQVREVLRKAGEPRHIDEIIKALGKDPKDTKVSLVGSLGQYIRRGAVFTRPAPNTFGLVEFDAAENEARDIFS